jgi:alpha-glucoside transport system substrate-binding protein
MNKRRYAQRLMAAFAASMLIIAACGSDGDANSATEATAPSETASGTAATAANDDTAAPSTTESAGDSAADISGQTVNIMGAFTEGQEDEFVESVKQWEEQTGAKVVYEGTGELTTLLTSRVEGGNPPDIAILPQPGLLADFARSGDLKDLSTVLDPEQVEADLIPGLYDLGVVDGTFYGLMYTVSIDSLEWYSPAAFQAAGYTVPATWQELVTLTATIAADAPEGTAPWCLGIESGEATGWVVTQWIEDLMLRTAGPEKYDQWVKGELKFASPEVTEAAEMFAEIALNFDNVYGGQPGMLTIGAGDDAAPLLEDPPGCYLNRQGSWMTGVFADAGADVGTDVDIFAVPELADGWEGLPVLGAGDLAALLTDNPAAGEFMKFMASAEAITPRVAGGYVFSPRQDFPAASYPEGILRKQAEILAAADAFRFDASDQMPGPVGTGAFWTEMVRWVNGEASLAEALTNIDAAWPST